MAGIRRTARSIDTSNKRSAWLSTYFKVGVVDVEVPLVSVDAPVVGAVVGSPVDVLGSASDDVAVDVVQVFIKDRVSGQYWNGAGWQSVFVVLEADLDAPDTGSTGWSYAFDLGGLTPSDGGYQATARSIDTSNKRSAWLSTYFKVGVPDVEDATITQVT